jgi:hypothetical protein
LKSEKKSSRSWSSSTAYNFSNWFGAVADLAAVHKGLIGGYEGDTTIMNYLFGPRFAYHHSKFTPFVQVLFGGAFGTTCTEVSLVPNGGADLPPWVVFCLPTHR